METAIDRHPQREQIINDILAGKPCRQIAATLRPPIHYVTIANYAKKRIKPKLEGAQVLAKSLQTLAEHGNQNVPILDPQQATRVALHADPLLSRIAQHQATIDGKLADTDARGAAALISADLRGIELHAKLTGRLDAQPAQVNMMIVCPAGSAPTAPTDSDEAVVIDIRPAK